MKYVGKRWGLEYDQAFARVNQLLTGVCVLHCLDYYKIVALHVEASDAGARTSLARQSGEDLNTISFYSQSNDSQCHDSAPLKYLYAVVLAASLLMEDTVCLCN